MITLLVALAGAVAGSVATFLLLFYAPGFVMGAQILANRLMSRSRRRAYE